MAVSNFYILTEEQYQKLISGQAQHHTLDTNGWYHTDKIPADLIDDTNSTKKMVTAVQVQRWTDATTAQADWDEDDPNEKAYIKNKPTIPQPDPPVVDVMVSTDGTNYVSILDANKIAKLDLTDYTLKSQLKTINGETIYNVNGGNLKITGISFIDCRTSAAAQPVTPNTSGLLKIVVTSDTTEPQIVRQDNYVYINLENIISS